MRAEQLLLTPSVWCGDTVLLKLIGELDLATAPLVDRAVSACLAGRPRRLRLDLTGLTLCDKGLQALQRLTDAARTADAVLCLAGVALFSDGSGTTSVISNSGLPTRCYASGRSSASTPSSTATPASKKPSRPDEPPGPPDAGASLLPLGSEYAPGRPPPGQAPCSETAPSTNPEPPPSPSPHDHPKHPHTKHHVLDEGHRTRRRGHTAARGGRAAR